jgi:L-asparagine oxygenase
MKPMNGQRTQEAVVPVPVTTQQAQARAAQALTPDEAVAFEWIARELCAAGPGRVDDHRWVAAAREGWDALPMAVRRAVRSFRRHSGPQGCLLLRGLPVGAHRLPPTPMVPESLQRTPTVAAAALMLVACGLGDPTAYEAEKSGALVQDVVPVPGKEEFQGNAGSVRLSFHVENAFHEHRPDYVMLLCLRPDHERAAGLRTACIRTVLPALAADTTQALFSNEFVTESPPSFSAGGAMSAHPVLFGAPEDPDLRIDFAATTPLSPRAAAAQAELARGFDAAARTVKLVPGDLAIVDNRVTVHGRTAFRPRYDGADRWLQRTFVAADMRRSRGYRPHDGYVLTR